ncbi:MAG: hypothetical protein M3320_00235 [Actinomycetota bacterium]|nr:hypothetical protein [Actinomycetota bacterium]MDQ5807084.1 hypothetical protein [Actinomycetota bacterium]
MLDAEQARLPGFEEDGECDALLGAGAWRDDLIAATKRYLERTVAGDDRVVSLVGREASQLSLFESAAYIEREVDGLWSLGPSLRWTDLLTYVECTGSVAAPERGGRITVILTRRDTRGCPYLAGLLRATGWRVVELHPYDEAAGRDDVVPCGCSFGLERRPMRMVARCSSGRRRRCARRDLDITSRALSARRPARAQGGRASGNPPDLPRDRGGGRRSYADRGVRRGAGDWHHSLSTECEVLPDLVAPRGMGRAAASEPRTP